jgi:predicted ATPase/DNA-binding CsgD family transcriptional regulator/Tfp pilus assembly protein PilF
MGVEDRGEDSVSTHAMTVTVLVAEVIPPGPMANTEKLAHVRGLVVEAIKRHGAVPLERPGGIGLLGAFASPLDAMACAIELQRAMSATGQPSTTLRVALHSAPLSAEDEGAYVGQLADRCGRLQQIGHGRQILLSRAVCELLAHALPGGVTLKDLGSHRLRDLTRVEHVYQLCHPELSTEFPPLASLDLLPNNLPTQLASFVGRHEQMAQIASLIEATRLLTLVGAGGCGKSRLAVHAAAQLLERYSDGAWFVDLSPTAEPSLVPNAVAKALSLQEEQFRTASEVLLAHIGSKSMLVVFDNCEHLLEPCAVLADTLRRGCPNLEVLATSRAPLGASGEMVFRVPSLSLPPEAADVPPEEVAAYEAAQLFIDRALKAQPELALSDRDGRPIAEICRRLDGIPLAIELAAARVRIFTLEQIARELADRFGVLTGGARSALPRHQTLRASMDWSYGLLTQAERALLRRSSVFAGSFSLDAARQVCAFTEEERRAALDALSGLIDKSLVSVEHQGEGLRYGLLETVRQYAEERLAEAGEEEQARTAHRSWYLALAEEAEPNLVGREQGRWCDELELEHDNVRAALEWSKRRGDGEGLLRLSGALTFFWFERGYLREGRAWLEVALEEGAGAPLSLLAKAYWGLAAVAMHLLDLAAVPPPAQQALSLYQQVGDPRGIGRSLTFLGWPAIFAHGPSKARPLLEQGVALARQTDDSWGLAMALQALGMMHLVYGDPREARQFLEESRSVAAAVGERFIALGSSVYLGWDLYWQGEFGDARAILEEAVSWARPSRHTFFLPMGLTFLGYVLMALGDYPRARASCEEGLAIARETRHLLNQANSLMILGWVARGEGKLQEARDLLEQAAASPVVPVTRATSVIRLADVERRLGDKEGARKHLDQALSFSREVGMKWPQAACLTVMARLAAAEGRAADAEDLFHQALALHSEVGDKAGVVEALEGLAELSGEDGDLRRAVRLLAAAQLLREQLGYVVPPVDRHRHERVVSSLRERLSAEEFASSWNDGLGLAMERAVEYASRSRGPRRRPTVGWESLTPTEREVAELVAEGLTNRHIGDRLFISARTVQTHLYRIFAKLGVGSRSELAAEVARRHK